MKKRIYTELAILLFVALNLICGCSKKRIMDNPFDPAAGNKAPNAPSDPSPTNGAQSVTVNPNLTWSCSDPNPDDTLRYDVYFNTSNPPNTKVAANQCNTSLSRSGLGFNTTYYWKIVAIDNHGATASGEVWQFTTLDRPNQVPNVPSNPSPPDGATNQPISLTLSWTCSDPDPDDSLVYDVYFDPGANPPRIKVANNQRNSNLPRSGLAYNTIYYWKVVAKDNHGDTTSGPVWSLNTRIYPWTTKAPMPTPRAFLAASETNNSILAIGGYDGRYFVTVEEYYPATNTWITRTSMPTPRSDLAAATLNGKIYAIGGYNHELIGDLPIVEEYDLAANTWLTKAPMLVARYAPAATAVNGKVYTIGGYSNENSVYLNSVEEYDPSTNTWVNKAPMPTARSGLVAVVANGKIYTLGGVNLTGPLSAVEEYDPTANIWTNKAPMPTPRCNLAAGTVNNKIYAIGGGDYMGNVLALVEEYDPISNTWVTKTPMLTARYAPAAVLNSKVYVIGGWNGGYLATTEEYNPLLEP